MKQQQYNNEDFQKLVNLIVNGKRANVSLSLRWG
ncbi:hypothetical protein KP509_39G030900 [Ceratopteris richardii]|uniref:Uncharacterized protein n=1 Tax=Ceratopteris richardii TaxID=49495 RepID=A0A8T2PZX2_CERRI|nr:hypothetical protein KP509_39G030900 [Ceratopteris richardii]